MQKYKIIILIIFSGFLLAGCTTAPTSTNPTPSTSSSSSSGTTTSGSFSASEVAKHATKSDCWMIISNKVYNVTNYINQHPGGNDILQGCGKDATQLFATQGSEGKDHSRSAKSLLTDFYVGDLIK